MFRFSTGLSLYGGNENDKGYLIYENMSEHDPLFTNSDFFQKHISSVGKRKWDVKLKGVLRSTQKPLEESVFNLFTKDLDLFNPRNVHPAFEFGFKNEIKRLFPKVKSSIVKKYEDFITFLSEDFGLEQELSADAVLKVYSDDIGPCLLVTLNDSYILPPELPTLYYAPKEWRIITWWINNYFSGPYPDDSHEEIIKLLKGSKFYWDKLEINDQFKNEKTEGLVYFMITKFIIIYEAWMYQDHGSIQAKSLEYFINLVQNKGHRPWRSLY